MDEITWSLALLCVYWVVKTVFEFFSKVFILFLTLSAKLLFDNVCSITVDDLSPTIWQRKGFRLCRSLETLGRRSSRSPFWDRSSRRIFFAHIIRKRTKHAVICWDQVRRIRGMWNRYPSEPQYFFTCWLCDVRCHVVIYKWYSILLSLEFCCNSVWLLTVEISSDGTPGR